jgi:O-antigen/teichoic acid export membrane protein
MVLFRLFDRAVGVISTSLLARLLVPADFGLVAMAMSVIALIDLATSFGFEVALIQKPDPRRELFDTAWTLNVLMATGGAIATVLLAYPTALFYGDDRLLPVMLVIGASWLISGFENIGIVNFRREMNFAAEFRLMASKRMVAFVITVACALVFRSYWALVIGSAAGRIAGVMLSYGMQSFRPRPSLTCARELFSFSGWILANNIAGVLLSRVPHFIVGKVYGAQALGSYSVGAEISQLAHTELVAPINRALFPGFARLAGDPQAFRRICVDATAAVFSIVLPVTVGMVALAESFVLVLLGPNWSATVPLIQVLAFAGAVSALTSNNFAAYLALGRPNLLTITLVTRLVVFVAMVLTLGRNHGVIGIVQSELVSAIAAFAVSLPMLMIVMQLKLRDYVAALWRPLLASALMGVALSEFSTLLPADGKFATAMLHLLAGIVMGAVVYLVASGLLWWLSGRPPSIEGMIVRKVREAFRGVTATPEEAD